MSADFANIPLTLISGTETTFDQIRKPATLVVNVASQCGLAPQYEQLEKLQQIYSPSGKFTVLGFPSNQFLQESAAEEQIAQYCAITWGVTFPMTVKGRVNGKDRHPLYQALIAAAQPGRGKRVKWNFEKFLVLPDDSVLRFSPITKPDAPELVSAIEKAIAAEP